MTRITPDLLRGRADRYRQLSEEATNPIRVARHRQLAELLDREADKWEQEVIRERQEKREAAAPHANALSFRGRVQPRERWSG